MAVVNQHNTAEIEFGGSDEIEAFLLAAQADAAFSTTGSATGWYRLSYLEGGDWGPERATTEIFSEGGTLVKTREDTNNFIITNTMLQSSAALFNFIAWGEENAFRVRYRQPQGDGLTTNQWLFCHNVLVRKEDRRTATARDGIRSIPFTLVATTDGTNPVRTIVDLPLLESDTAWDSYTEFKSDAVA